MHIESLETRVQFSGSLGSWSGPGITSSGAIGIAEASAYTPTFLGQQIDSTTVLIRYDSLGLVGDPTLDGKIDRADVQVLLSNFNKSGGFRQGDSNFDGVVRIDDFALMAQRANELAERVAGVQ